MFLFINGICPKIQSFLGSLKQYIMYISEKVCKEERFINYKESVSQFYWRGKRNRIVLYDKSETYPSTAASQSAQICSNSRLSLCTWKGYQLVLLYSFLMQVVGSPSKPILFVLLTVRVFQQPIARWFHGEILQNFRDGEHC